MQSGWRDAGQAVSDGNAQSSHQLTRGNHSYFLSARESARALARGERSLRPPASKGKRDRICHGHALMSAAILSTRFMASLREMLQVFDTGVKSVYAGLT